VAQALAARLKRPADVAARYGGEEFAAILPDTDAAQARQLAENIREYVASLKLPHAPAPCVPGSPSASAWPAWARAARRCGGLIEAADKALYAAKRGGRDRVVVDGEA
jgi:diguanylate cyclase (GGDEF)-like protein